MPKHPLRYRAVTFSIFPLMRVNFTNFLGIACTFLQHINQFLGRFFPLGGSQLESLDRPFTQEIRGIRKFEVEDYMFVAKGTA